MAPEWRREPNILVVGGAGYIGSVLAGALLAREYRVRCLDALLYDTGSAVATLLENARFSFVHGDMRHPDVLARALSGITHVVLLASLVGDPICRKYPALAREINLNGSIVAYEAARAAGVDRFIFLSTCSNYGARGDAEATEDAELNPQSLYAETKVAFEHYLLARTSIAPCVTILRLATAFGLSPRMRFDLTISEFARALALGRELTVYNPYAWRPYCHVRDTARAVITVLEADRPSIAGQVFNVGGDAENYTKAMLVGKLQAVVPTARVRFTHECVDCRSYRVSFKKIRHMLGFVPDHTVDDAIAVLVRAVQSGAYGDVEARTSFYSNTVIVHEPPLQV